MHRLQAMQRLEVQARVAHRKVVALHQRQAQVARQVRVFKVGLVVRAGREQHDARIRPRRAHLPQPVEQRAVGGGQALHMHLAERLGEQARDEQPVLQQIPQARGSLCALCDHPPVALRIARHVEGRYRQVRSAHRLHAVHGAQVAGVALHQRAGQQAAAQQLLRAIDVGHHAVEQAGALQHAALDVRPVALREDQRKQVHRPGPLRAVGVGIDVVGDAVVAHLPLQALHAPVQVLKALGAQLIEKLGPGASDVWVVCYGVRSGCCGGRAGVARHTGTPQLVKMPGRRSRRQRSRPLGRAVGRVGGGEAVVEMVHCARFSGIWSATLCG